MMGSPFYDLSANGLLSLIHIVLYVLFSLIYYYIMIVHYINTII